MNPPQNSFVAILTAFSVPISILLAGILIAGAIYFALSGGNYAQNQEPEPIAVDVADVKIENSPFIGKEDAPLTIAIWSDYQCPFCRAIETGHPQIPIKPAMSDVVKNYVDTGKVKVVFKDFVFLGPDSNIAARYGRAVWELYPTQFYEWRTQMFAKQPEENSLSEADYTKEIDKITSAVKGVDLAKIKAKVASDSARYDSIYQADTAEAQSMGINGTPGTIIGKQLISGAADYERFSAAIEAELK